MSSTAKKCWCQYSHRLLLVTGVNVSCWLNWWLDKPAGKAPHVSSELIMTRIIWENVEIKSSFGLKYVYYFWFQIGSLKTNTDWNSIEFIATSLAIRLMVAETLTLVQILNKTFKDTDYMIWCSTSRHNNNAEHCYQTVLLYLIQSTWSVSTIMYQYTTKDLKKVEVNLEYKKVNRE